jgi:hypothetical protein
MSDGGAVLFWGSCATGIRAYEQLGYRAFGTPGKMAAGIAITLQNIGGEEQKRKHTLSVPYPPTPPLVLNLDSKSLAVFKRYLSITITNGCVCSAAMSSYLYIVKYEFPLVIQAFLRLDKPEG